MTDGGSKAVYVVLLHKANFHKPKLKRHMAFVYSEYFYKGGKRVSLSSSVLDEPTCNHHHSSHIKALPRLTLEEMNLYIHVD